MNAPTDLTRRRRRPAPPLDPTQVAIAALEEAAATLYAAAEQLDPDVVRHMTADGPQRPALRLVEPD